MHLKKETKPNHPTKFNLVDDFQKFLIFQFLLRPRWILSEIVRPLEVIANSLFKWLLIFSWIRVSGSLFNGISTFMGYLIPEPSF